MRLEPLVGSDTGRWVETLNEFARDWYSPYWSVDIADATVGLPVPPLLSWAIMTEAQTSERRFVAEPAGTGRFRCYQDVFRDIDGYTDLAGADPVVMFDGELDVTVPRTISDLVVGNFFYKILSEAEGAGLAIPTRFERDAQRRLAPPDAEQIWAGDWFSPAPGPGSVWLQEQRLIIDLQQQQFLVREKYFAVDQPATELWVPLPGDRPPHSVHLRRGQDASIPYFVRVDRFGTESVPASSWFDFIELGEAAHEWTRAGEVSIPWDVFSGLWGIVADASRTPVATSGVEVVSVRRSGADCAYMSKCGDPGALRDLSLLLTERLPLR